MSTDDQSAPPTLEERLREYAVCFDGVRDESTSEPEISHAELCRDSADELARLTAEVARLTAASDAYQEDVRALLLALGLGDRARPASPHDVLRGEVLPAIERMKVQDGALLSEAWERSLEHVNTMQRAITIMQEDIDRPLFTTRKEKTHEHAG